MEEKKVAGIITGNALDEINACVAIIRDDLTFQIIDTISIGFDIETKATISDIKENKASLKDICKINFKLAQLFSSCIKELATKPDIIASGGYTVCHLPNCATLNLGDISTIANLTNTLTIGDFGASDIAAGGSGNNLFPFCDEVIFGRDKTRCINSLGAISSVTILDATGRTSSFDTGPANILLDYFAQHLFQQKCDFEGRLAYQGHVDDIWLNKLLNHPFYQKSPQKNVSQEDFGTYYASRILNSAPTSKYDIMATISALTVKSIYNAYNQFIFDKLKPKEIIFTGGGTQNRYIMNLLEKHFYPTKIKTLDDFQIEDKYKKALCFAILGYCTYNQIPNNLPSCTGASRPVVMGKIAHPSL